MKTVDRFYILLCVFVLLTGCGARATQSPEQVVAQTAQSMIDALTENKTKLKDEPRIVYDLINTIVLPHFDVDYVVRLILGKYWRQATPEQRSRFSEAFKTLIMDSYAKSLLEYSGEKVQVLPVVGKPVEGRTLVVHSLVHTTGAKPIEVNYRMRKKEGDWKVIDFTVEGVSLILNYKHSFAEQIQGKGLDALIDSIERKNADFKF
jgi:phospholipid transport system substrate-binding protein